MATTTKSWTLNIPHLLNSVRKIARELNTAVSTLMGADADIELSFSVGSKGIVLALSAPHLGLDDYQVDAPALCQADHFSQPLRQALLDTRAQAWIRAAGTIAQAREEARQSAGIVTLVIG